MADRKTKVCFPIMYILPLMKYLVALPPVSNANYSIAKNVKYVKYLKLLNIYHSFLLILPWTMALGICNQVSLIKDFDPECNICNIHVMNKEGHCI